MIRTSDARFRKPTLYPLSYGGICNYQLLNDNICRYPFSSLTFNFLEFAVYCILTSMSKGYAAMSGKEKVTTNIMLFSTAFLWGTSYTVRKMAVVFINPFYFNAFRFFLAFVTVFAAYLINSAIQKTRGNGAVREAEIAYKPVRWQISGGVLIGLAYGFGANFQQFGLMTSDAGKCGFISALYIFFVPLISRLVLKRKIAGKIWFGAALATVGLFFVSVGTGFNVITGDLMFLIAAVCFAIQTIMIGYYVRYSNPLFIVSMSLITCSVLSMILSVLFERGNSPADLIPALFAAVYTGMITIGAANVLQFIAQKKASPPVAAIILSFESVFAALCAAIFISERMNSQQISGCCIIFFAIMISQIDRKAKELSSS